MKWYVIVEGLRTEKRIYAAWIAHVFPTSQVVRRIEDMAEDRYFLVAGLGYPSYLERIRNAIADIRDSPDSFDHLWICVDAEEMAASQRRAELEELLVEEACPIDYTVVVQDCCIETWLLGNRRFAKRNPQSELLRAYYAHYDVRVLDPESLPALEPDQLRAPFHLEYLRELFRERQLSYTKTQPREARERTYLEELVRRSDETGHLESFGLLVQRWRTLGGRI